MREQREQILGRIAYEHLLDVGQPTNSLHWSQAIRIVKEIMKLGELDAEALFRELAKETGLITEERSSQTFRFIHLTFCEFLAAYEAIQGQEHGWNILIESHKRFQRNAKEPQLRSRLLEVIPFACGLVPRVNRASALSDVSSVADDALLARCFLETKQYDHGLWPAFAQRQKTALLSTPESQWNGRWLADLHLFNVVVKDAIQCALHMAILDSRVDLDQFFQTLVRNQKASLSKLLSSYATQDAAAAFRLAELSNLNLLGEFPEIIIANCDQFPFLALVLERAMTDPMLLDHWATLLSEAALRSRVVAARLYNMKRAPDLKERLSRIGQKRRWYKPGFVKQTLLTELLTIALNSERETQLFSCLNVLKSVRAPGDHWFNPRLICLWLLFGVIACMLVNVAVEPTRIRWFQLVASCYACFFIMSCLVLYVEVYNILIHKSEDNRIYDLVDSLPFLRVFPLPWIVRRMLFLASVSGRTRAALREMQSLRFGVGAGTYFAALSGQFSAEPSRHLVCTPPSEVK